jgi:branched-chain amino acid transport system ATP-binding protein
VDLLQVQHLSKRFSGLQALHEISFQIPKGSIVGLIGPNGAGKTTLFNVITGLLPPEGGRIVFRGKDITGLKAYEVCREGISRTFQIARPFTNLSVLENVRLGAFNRCPDRYAATRKAIETCEFAGLLDKADRLCKFLTLQDQKKLELARALATEPELILLDEVMNGLNPSEIGEMVMLIRRIRDKGVTVFVIEHIMKAIMSFSDQVIVISFGELIAQGPPEAIVSNPNVIEAYLGEEFSFVKRS